MGREKFTHLAQVELSILRGLYTLNLQKSGVGVRVVLATLVTRNTSLAV